MRSTLGLLLLTLLGCHGAQKREAEKAHQLRNCWELYGFKPGVQNTGYEGHEVQRCLVARYDWDADSTLFPVLDKQIEERAKLAQDSVKR